MSADIAQILSEQIAASFRAIYGEQAVLPDPIPLDRPKNRDHGDYATSIALSTCKGLGLAPREVAVALAAELEKSTLISAVDIAGPGFINITLSNSASADLIISIIEKSSSFGHSKLLDKDVINLEFISANPTGPLHLGHTRWAAVGDSLGRLLKAAGAHVTQEFYINDRGVQMDLFGKSLRAAALGEPTPEDGYHGEYIQDIARIILEAHPEYLSLEESDSIAAFRDSGYAWQLKDQQRVLESIRTKFDVWFSEKSLYEGDLFDSTISNLRKHGHVFENEGAIWLRTTDFGDDKDRVIQKSDGALAYFASDCAYYNSKRNRGFNVNIYLLGADHHGYVGRLKALAACAGDDPEKNIEVLIGQMVKIMENGEEVKLSKRAGTIITLEELVEKVGVDAARYTLIRYPTDTPMVMDVDLLRKNTNENPVFYVQYAHARICALLRTANERNIEYGAGFVDGEILTHARERELIGKLSEFPSLIESAAKLREPHRIARYIEELAGLYHGFYADCRVLPQAEEQVEAIHNARITLCQATAQVIANGLDILGVSAPEKM